MIIIGHQGLEVWVMVTEAPAYPFERIKEIILNITRQEDRVYAELLYCLACREGEIVPYTHYKHKYSKKKRDNNDEPPQLLDKKHSICSYGINIDDVLRLEDHIAFERVPVFKTKNKNEHKPGFILNNHPFYFDILNWVEKRKNLRQQKQAVGDTSAVYLFDVPSTDPIVIQRNFWARRKRLERALKKSDESFRIHSLRKSRATLAGVVSGNIFYVRDLLGHRTIEQSSKYVARKKLFDSMKKYEGGL